MSDQNSILHIEKIRLETGDFLLFKNPIELRIEKTYDREDDQWSYLVDCDKFGIYILEEKIEDVKTAFEDDLVFCWETYAEESDEKLSPGAIQLKKDLLSSIIKIKYIGTNRYTK